MLIYTDPSWRTTLSKKEALLEKQESTYQALEKHRLPFQQDYTDMASRRGRMMHSNDLFRRLKKIIPRFYVVPGNMEGYAALYYIPEGNIKYICACPVGMLTEYSVYILDDRDLPKKDLRGWRTVLIRCIEAGIVTEDAVRKEFGHPSNGIVSTFYRRHLYRIRNGRLPN